jgi:YVTN family beta-propeller protein
MTVPTLRILSKLLFMLIILLITACDDMTDKTVPVGEVPYEEGNGRLYILSEGLYSGNNSYLAYYDFETKSIALDWFGVINQRKLGDTANDLGVYGSKLYIVMNTAGIIEVVDKESGRSVGQIPVKNENGRSREPRYIAFHKGFAYVCSFDNTVAEIDTASLKLTRLTTAGRNPDGITVANNKIYVSNSGGLSNPAYDSTVSVIDPVSFSEIKKITVGHNPYTLKANSKGQLFVVTRGNYGAQGYRLHRIDTTTDRYEKEVEGLHPLNFTLRNDTLWMYSYNFTTGSNDFQQYDSRNDQLITNNFITDNTPIRIPYGISAHPRNGDIFVVDTPFGFSTRGDVLCFTNDGKLKYRLKSVGVNPNKVVAE